MQPSILIQKLVTYTAGFTVVVGSVEISFMPAGHIIRHDWLMRVNRQFTIIFFKYLNVLSGYVGNKAVQLNII